MRGHLVLASGPGEYKNKPRPFVIVQSDAFNDAHESFSLCPVTSVISGNHLFRVAVTADAGTGLDRDSEVQVDKVQSLRRERIIRVTGTVPATILTRIDDALRRWLQL